MSRNIATQVLLSPAELSYLHSSLLQQPPIRPDLRKPTQFRPLIAETDVLPTTNGSARICFNDGTEAIVGVKAEVEKSQRQQNIGHNDRKKVDTDEMDIDEDKVEQRALDDSWLEISLDVSGLRDDDNLPVFLSSMLTEALVASKMLMKNLRINARWNWRLYIDILTLSPPLSYPLPLLSLTTHLALLNTRLPRIVSDPGDDPLFDDDWAAAVPLYPQQSGSASISRPPVTLLVMNVGTNILFDPSQDELAVADGVFAISVADDIESQSSQASLRLLAIRTVDPPSRLTSHGIPDSANPATVEAMQLAGRPGKPVANPTKIAATGQVKAPVWNPPRGGVKRKALADMVRLITKPGGVGQEVLEGLANVKS